MNTAQVYIIIVVLVTFVKSNAYIEFYASNKFPTSWDWGKKRKIPVWNIQQVTGDSIVIVNERRITESLS